MSKSRALFYTNLWQWMSFSVALLFYHAILKQIRLRKFNIASKEVYIWISTLFVVILSDIWVSRMWLEFHIPRIQGFSTLGDVRFEWPTILTYPVTSSSTTQRVSSLQRFSFRYFRLIFFSPLSVQISISLRWLYNVLWIYYKEGAQQPIGIAQLAEIELLFARFFFFFPQYSLTLKKWSLYTPPCKWG